MRKRIQELQAQMSQREQPRSLHLQVGGGWEEGVLPGLSPPLLQSQRYNLSPRDFGPKG